MFVELLEEKASRDDTKPSFRPLKCEGINHSMNTRAGYEKQAVQYLLGELTEADQTRLEERFFQDAELSDLLSEIEDDLIDQYVRGDLSSRERERFENHFLISERRHRKVELARSWLQAEKQRFEVASEKPASWWQKILAAMSAPRPAFAYALAGLALVFLLGGLWQFSEIRQLRKQVAAIESERNSREGQEDQLRKQAEDERQRNDELKAEKERLEQELARVTPQPVPPSTYQPSSASALAFVLLPGVRGSEAPRELVVPRSTESVRLQLNLNPGDQYSVYQVTVQTASGSPVRSWNRLNAALIQGRRVVSITVQSKLLNTGQYELTLSGVVTPNRKEDLGYYYINLRKE
jgi:hypothetical protein